MKKNLFLVASLLVFSVAGFCQNQLNLVIFSEDGDLFFAYINGIRQNDKPEPNVKITGLTNPNISLRIEFNDKALPQLKQNMALETGFEHTAKIKRDMKKQLKLRYFGQTPLDNSTSPNVSTVAYHTAENPVTSDAPQAGNSNASITSSTTSTQTYNSSTTANPSININMGGAGISMNVSGMEPNAGGMNTTTSTTVTSSSYSSGSSVPTYYDNATPARSGNSAAAADSNAGCSTAMSGDSFIKMRQSVESKPFSDTKMSTAKVATKNTCLSVSQVKEITKLFNMDEEKLAYAKYAYDYCVDKANYYQVSDAFSFSTTTDELNKYLEKH